MGKTWPPQETPRPGTTSVPTNPPTGNPKPATLGHLCDPPAKRHPGPNSWQCSENCSCLPQLCCRSWQHSPKLHCRWWATVSHLAAEAATKLRPLCVPPNLFQCTQPFWWNCCWVPSMLADFHHFTQTAADTSLASNHHNRFNPTLPSNEVSSPQWYLQLESSWSDKWRRMRLGGAGGA